LATTKGVLAAVLPELLVPLWLLLELHAASPMTAASSVAAKAPRRGSEGRDMFPPVWRMNVRILRVKRGRCQQAT
jgi:hypothetical protein